MYGGLHHVWSLPPPYIHVRWPSLIFCAPQDTAGRTEELVSRVEAGAPQHAQRAEGVGLLLRAAKLYCTGKYQ